MTADPKSIARSVDRHSHINIGLRLRQGDTWEPVEALGRNAVGFNFYHHREITDPVLELRRQLTPFEGRIAWSAPNTSDDVLASALLNERIYQQAKALVGNAALQHRLLKLMRVADMLAQKQAVLASLGQPLGDAEMARLVARRRQERPLYQYGVRVDAEAWRTTVHKASSLSSAVASLEQWADSFSSK
ncbi:MAG: hypothetical protein HXX19_01175 [Rhodoferax sp.]|nr:hypothetical protein [Rhodoferax sp.]